MTSAPKTPPWWFDWDVPNIPDFNYPETWGPVELACLGHALNCIPGACAEIICIGGTGGPLSTTVIDDPTGVSWTDSGGMLGRQQVCISEGAAAPSNSSITAVVSDGTFQSVVTMTLLDCDQEECCPEGVTVVGSGTATVSGGSWVGTISPPCPGAVPSMNGEDTTDMTPVVSGDGSTVTVTLGASACGAFSVTIQLCGESIESNTVRITDSGHWDACTGGSSWGGSCTTGYGGACSDCEQNATDGWSYTFGAWQVSGQDGCCEAARCSGCATCGRTCTNVPLTYETAPGNYACAQACTDCAGSWDTKYCNVTNLVVWVC